MDESDGALLARVHGGDEAAFLLLYERHRRPLFRFAYRMLGATPTAEDVVHECFLVILTHPMKFDPSRASLRTFLCAIARNLSFKQLRRKGQETLADDALEPLEPTAPEPGPLKQLLEGERASAVQEAVAALPPLQREVIVLFEYEGHSLAEMAEIVAADVGTVKARLHRARERLRRSLAPWLAASGTPAAGGAAAALSPIDRTLPGRRGVEKMA
jgi:RNA polymerase sigma-70 factor (ECF subfamily)